MQNILLAYDGSESSTKAYATALEIAAKFNSELYVISIARPPEPVVDLQTEEFLEKVTQYFQKDFEKMQAKATEHGVKTHFEILAGHPAQAIVHYAQAHKINLIITGTVKEKSTLDLWVLGSVSTQVLHHAHCSVLVVR